MKVYIGDYKSWFGPYQIADLFKHIGLTDDQCSEVGDWLANKTPCSAICQWIYDHRRRNEIVQLHPWDTWNMDHTLALIIHPALKKMRSIKQGATAIDIEDLPEELRTASEVNEDGDASHEFYVKQWQWVMDEMIWAFGRVLADDEEFESLEKEKALIAREANGRRLFAKYYRTLWT